MKAKKKSLLFLLSLSIACTALAGCANNDTPEFVTAPQTSLTPEDGGDESVYGSEDENSDTQYAGTTSPDSPEPTSDSTAQTLIAVVMDQNGNIVTDSSGNPVTAVVEVTSPYSTNDQTGTGSASASTTKAEITVQAGGTMYTNQRVMLSEGPSVYAASIQELAPNTPITVMSLVSDGWYAVNVGGNLGYLPASALSIADANGFVTDPDGNIIGGPAAATTTVKETTTTTQSTTTTTQKTTTTTKKTTTTTKKTTTAKKKTTTTTTTKKTTTTSNKTTTTKKPATLNYDAQTNEYINEVIRLVNVEREKNGLKPLTLDIDLTTAAMVRAKEIISSFVHTRPNGAKFSTALDEQGIYFKKCGENIAYGYPTPQSVVDGWMASEGHRKNILSSEFTHIGIGYCVTMVDNKQVAYWVQEFCSYWS